MSKRVAVIVGASGGIGGALCEELSLFGDFDTVIRLSRPSLNLCDEASIAQAAADLPSGCVRLVINAAGSYTMPRHNQRNVFAISIRHLWLTILI